MRLSLLTPPTESPRLPQVSTQLPLPRGWPGEREIAVDTRALPRSLPLTPMDPAVASAPFEAMARLGATGAQVSTQILGIVLEAQARKKEATELADVDRIYTATENSFNREFAKHKVTSDHATFLQGFDELWKKASDDAMAQAPSPAAARLLATKLRGYSVTKTAEALAIDTSKFQDYQQAQFQGAVKRDTLLATEALSEETRDHHLKDLESTFRSYARAGSIPLKQIQDAKEKALDTIRTDRAMNEAYTAPLSVLQRVANGDYTELESKEKRTLMEYAENRLRTLRSDADNMAAKERRVAKEQQDDLAITLRTRISENYRADGPGLDLTMEINKSARALGETNHKELLEMERVYRERALKPPKEIKSDKGTVGKITTAYRTGRVGDYTDADLLHMLDNGMLDEGDHRYLSGLRAQTIAQRKAEAKEGQTDAEHLRKEQVKDAEKTIDEYLKRGSRFQGDPASQGTDILIRDATNELHQRLAADPNARPGDVATDVIVGRIEKAEKISKALPYKTKEDVAAAYAAGNITKATATRYYRILEALEKSKPGTEAAPPPPKEKGLVDKFKGLFGGGEESPVRAPVKP